MRIARQVPGVHSHRVEFPDFGVKLFGGGADNGSISVVVGVYIGGDFGGYGVVSAAAPRVTTQNPSGSEPQPF